MNSISSIFKQARYTGTHKRELCKWCGKSRSNSNKKFGTFCRICLRNKFSNGSIPGFVKSSH